MSTVGITSAATGFLGRDPRLGKMSRNTRHPQGFPHVSRNPHWGYGELSYDGRRRFWIGETVSRAALRRKPSTSTTATRSSCSSQGTGTARWRPRTSSHRYLWGPAVDQLLADEQLGGPNAGGHWTLTDNENTVRDLATYSNGTTTVVNHREFSAYGELLSQTNPQTGTCGGRLPLRLHGPGDEPFQHGPNDRRVTGMQNNDNRWYDAVTGRWLSQDPKAFWETFANLSQETVRTICKRIALPRLLCP